MSREIHLGETLKMYDVYFAGSSMEAVASQFSRSVSGVQKAFARWRLPVRPSGGNLRAEKAMRPAPERKYASAPGKVIAFVAPPRVSSWCSQCEERVAPETAARCQSRWCKAKASDMAMVAYG